MRGVGGTVIQKTPKLGLPRLAFAQAQQFAALPAVDPIGAVNQILVEDVGQLAGELISGLFAVAQISCQRLAAVGQLFIGLQALAAEQIQQPPAHHFGGKRAECGGIGQDFAHQPPSQCGGQAETQVGGDAAAFGQILVEKSAHSLALHHQLFGNEQMVQRLTLANGLQQLG